mgnify:CR=1 FL=1
MNVRTLILAILNMGAASGYEIKKMSSEGRFSYFVDISYGSIYPTLARLEAEGMVDCRIESHPGKPDRKIYSITPGGRAELVEGLGQTPQRDIFKSEFLLLAMNADLVGHEVVARALAQRIADLEGELAMLDEIRDGCDHPATCWVADYGRYIKGNVLEYLRKNGMNLVAMAGGRTRKAPG